MQQALQYVLTKQKILRTSLIFNNDEGILKQYINDNHHIFTLADGQTFKNENELQNIVYQTTIDRNLFDLSNGRVFQCQILRQQKLIDENHDKELITESDVLIIAFHHAAFDGSSDPIFYNELCTAYNNNSIWPQNEELLQYIDYSIHERLMDMTLSRQFWKSELEGYNLELSLLLPVDRHRLSTDQRSGLASTARISFDNDFTTTFLDYASSHQVTPFQLGLATFYAFLFKLTHGQNDLCTACLHANRYRTELQNMIGMFVTTLPYRVRFDPQWSFDQLVKHVREKSLAILEHSYYPLQYILADTHVEQSNTKFLETMFDFMTVSSNIDQLSLDETILEKVSLQEISEVAKFDLALRFLYNSTLNDGKLSYRFICSRDHFDEMTVTNIGRQFQYFCFQLFSSEYRTTQIDQSIKPINKLSLILPEDSKELQRVLFHRLTNILNEGMYISMLFPINYVLLIHH